MAFIFFVTVYFTKYGLPYFWSSYHIVAMLININKIQYMI